MKILQIRKHDELKDSLSINEIENRQRLQILLLKPKQQDSIVVTTIW
jgi:hypothetical protein